MAAFTDFTGSALGDTSLTDALLAPGSGISIITGSIVLKESGTDAVSFYDGSLTSLEIGSGLLITSGTIPGTSNTLTWFGTDNSGFSSFYNGDPAIDAVVNTVFSTVSYDATTLEFAFNLTDPNTTSISFDIVFGSDEYPEWVDQFVDCAVVMVNGVNYALFNHDPMAPLSVISPNLAAGYFQDNAIGTLPIEYDGISHRLKIIAPVIAGQTNTIKIGIADTGDHIYDSGVFISNLSAGTGPGSGVVSPTTGTDSPDTLSGSAKAEYFDLKDGDDIAYAGGGDDVVAAGAGNDTVYGGSGADALQGGTGNDALDGGTEDDTAYYSGNASDYAVAWDAVSNAFTVTDTNTANGNDGTDTLNSIEYATFANGTYQLTTGGLVVVTSGTPPTNTLGNVIVNGVGAAGSTLTAIVSDVNGLDPATITYQWQSSADGGISWTNVGPNGATYVLSDGDVGHLVQVLATYTDNAGNAEAPLSAAKSVLAASNGDLTVTLLQIDAPVGSGVADPLTTLVQNAIELGLNANSAAKIVKAVLGIDADVPLQSYDSYAALVANPADPIALQVEKVSVQAAVLCSLSSDESGMNLTLAILNAATNNQTLNLADSATIENILSAVLDPQSTLFANASSEIGDRNASIASFVADQQPSILAQINAEWQDMLSVNDLTGSSSIADLVVDLNLAPVGSPTAQLADGAINTPYIVSAVDLLTGFSDPDAQDTLSVINPSADKGIVSDNGDGTFTITPDTDYSGPVEFTYTVSDGNGGTITAAQLFVIPAPSTPPVNNAPTGAPTAALAGGTEDSAYDVSAADLLTGFSDADGDPLSVVNLSASTGMIIDNGNGTYTITPDANYNGSVTLTYDVTDGIDTLTGNTQSFALAAVNDAPTGTSNATLAGGSEDTPYTITAADLLAGFSDVEDDPLSVVNLSASNGMVVDNGNGTYTITPDANYNGSVTLTYDVTDGIDTLAGNTQSFALAAVNDAPVLTGIPATLANGTQDTAYTVSETALLTGFTDVDGDTLHATGVTASNGTVVNNGNGTWTITPPAGYTGNVALAYSVSDGRDSIAGAQHYSLLSSGVTLTGDASANVLSGTSGSDALYGLGGKDKLIGGAGNDTLDGGAGADKLLGGTDNDTYYVDATGDAITENAGEGNDTVLTTLASYTLSANVENLILAGSFTANGTGNVLDNTITGNAFANVLSGLGGNDVIDGGTGNDKLLGGIGNDVLFGDTGADNFRFDTALNGLANVDIIQDFNVPDDTIELENAIFKSLKKTGALADANFAVIHDGGGALDANDYVLYNTDAGALYYDADGNGSGAAVQFATLQAGLALTAVDFLVT